MISYDRTGSELTVNTTYARTQAHAEVTRLADGRLVVVWVDADFNTSAGRYIRAQVYEADGTPAGGELTVAGPLNGAIQPTVTGLAGGGFVIGWDGASSTKAQVFDSAGAAVGGTVTLATHSGVGHGDIAALADGGFALVWDHTVYIGETSDKNVHMRTFDATGAATSGEVLVNTATAGKQDYASVAVLAGGNRVVTWFDAPGGFTPAAVRAQIFDAAGAPVGGEFAINLTSGVAEMAAPVIALANGNFAVAWYQYDSTSGSGQHLQVFSAGGERLGSEIVVPVELAGTQTGPAIAELADGSLAIAWLGSYGTTSDGSGRGVFVQVFDDGGTAFGPPMQVNTQANGDQIDPSIAALDNGGFMVTWTDLNGEGADDDQVMAQVFGPTGTPDPVTIVSNGGGEEAAIEATENGLAAALVDATGGVEAIGYAITGGADAALFAIDAESGALSFVVAPDFEAPGDADGDNLYDVTVTASDGQSSDSQAIRIAIGDVNEAPVLGSGPAWWVDENTLVAATVAATDPDGDGVTYEIVGGADAALFAIDSETGEVRFVSAPDFDTPGDADGDNLYAVTVSASDGSLSSLQALTIAVVDVDEAPAFLSGPAWTVDENLFLVGQVAAVDPEGDAVEFFIVGGADAGLFGIDYDGVLGFAAQPDFEAPLDADGDNVYELEIAAYDGEQASFQTVTVTVADVAEQPLTFLETAFGVHENVFSGIALGLLGGDEAEPVSFAVTGGADAGLFAFGADPVVIEFAGQDFEAPADADGDNVYEVEVTGFQGGLSVTETLHFQVYDINEAPELFVSPIETVDENDLFVEWAAASDPEGDSLTYFIAGGADAALFAIDPYDGMLEFVAAPDFEAPADADGDNVYEVEIGVSDGELADVEAVAVVVENVFGSTLNGSSGSNVLVGTSEEDTLRGNGGNDRLIGGAGADVLVGGTGRDEFEFTSIGDSTVAASDQILDFTRGSSLTRDRIDLAAIDANTGLSGNQAFAFIGSAAFSGQAGQLRAVQQGGAILVQGDVNGDGLADLQIFVDGPVSSLVSSDFLL